MRFRLRVTFVTFVNFSIIVSHMHFRKKQFYCGAILLLLFLRRINQSLNSQRASLRCALYCESSYFGLSHLWISGISFRMGCRCKSLEFSGWQVQVKELQSTSSSRASRSVARIWSQAATEEKDHCSRLHCGCEVPYPIQFSNFFPPR